jgi:hypothetical protein
MWYHSFFFLFFCRHIPRLKSHCAVEMTLDRCVQRLRRRILQESWEKRSSDMKIRRASIESETAQEKIGKRVPSFYTSPSLVNMGGLNVGDQVEIQDFSPQRHDLSSIDTSVHDNTSSWSQHVSQNNFEIGQGWGGMGLRGNFSSGSLHRQNSSTSAFYWDEDGDEEDDEQTELRPKLVPARHNSFSGKSPGLANENGYIKTSSMANFYYRKSQSHSDLHRQF